MRTISVRLDDGSEARLDSLCQSLGLSQTEVVKAGLVSLQRQSASPAALAERLGLIGGFSSATPGSTTSRSGDVLAHQMGQRPQHGVLPVSAPLTALISRWCRPAGRFLRGSARGSPASGR